MRSATTPGGGSAGNEIWKNSQTRWTRYERSRSHQRSRVLLGRCKTAHRPGGRPSVASRVESTRMVRRSPMKRWTSLGTIPPRRKGPIWLKRSEVRRDGYGRLLERESDARTQLPDVVDVTRRAAGVRARSGLSSARRAGAARVPHGIPCPQIPAEQVESIDGIKALLTERP